MVDSEEVPICISGGITATHPSLCMDEATHLIHTPLLGSLRLVATNKAARAALEEFQGTKVIVSVCGYPRKSPNCQHVDVYSVGLSSELAPKLQSL